MIPLHGSPVTNAGGRNTLYCSYGYSLLCGLRYRALTQFSLNKVNVALLDWDLSYGYWLFCLLNNCKVWGEKYLQIKEISIRQMPALPESVMAKCEGTRFYMEVTLLQNYFWLEAATSLNRRWVVANESSSVRWEVHRHILSTCSATLQGAAQDADVEGHVSSCKMLMTRRKHNSRLKG